MARILIIDDETSFADNLVKLLTRRGYEAVAAYDGAAAVRCFAENEFDVVVLDLRMPGMNGLEVLKFIKKNRPLVETIILTGHGSVDSAMDGMRMGAFDYAMKPIVLGDLLERIGLALERKLLREDAQRRLGCCSHQLSTENL